MQTSDEKRAITKKRLELMQKLCKLRPPPYWLEHVLAFCRFHRLQLDYLFETASRSDFTALTFNAQYIKTRAAAGQAPDSGSEQNLKEAIQYGLLEPILQSIADYYEGDLAARLNSLKKILTEEAFPGLFLAYLGMRTNNTPLVEICVDSIITRPSGRPPVTKSIRHELGMAYRVWRYLFMQRANQAEYGAAKVSQLHEKLQELADKYVVDDGIGCADWTFVHLAAAYGDQECLEFLLTQKRYQSHRIVADTTTELEGFTALHLAAWYGHTAIVEILLRHADKYLHTRGEKHGQPPSDNIAEEGPQDQYSHQHQLDDKPIPVDRLLGRSPLHYAAFFGYTEIVQRLVDRWGSRGVDLPDRFGITALHLSAFAINCDKEADHTEMLTDLIEKSKNPNAKVHAKDSVLQRAMISRFLIDRRNYVNSLYEASTGPRSIATAPARRLTLFNIPSPNILYSVRYWPIAPGFTVLHILVNLDRRSQLWFLFDRSYLPLDWDAKDYEGLNPIEYADSYDALREFAQLAAIQVPLFQKPSTFRQEVLGIINRSSVQFQKDARLSWVYLVDTCLLSGKYSEALFAVHRPDKVFDKYLASFNQPEAAGLDVQLQVDDEVWDHLEWALDKTLMQYTSIGGEDNYYYIGASMQPSEVENMVVSLVKRKRLSGKSPLQRCLHWAMSHRMTRLTNYLLKETECELVAPVPGGKHSSESPLARASKSGLAEDMPGLLTRMELREDVKKLWEGERKVYVDHANTLLVGAVLIAGLAFAGWLQPPGGLPEPGHKHRTEAVDMKDPAIRVFVWSGILAFAFGMATVVAAAQGAMPYSVGTGQLMGARSRLQRATVLASVLLVASIIFLSISFSAAALAIIPLSKNPQVAVWLAMGGLLLAAVLLLFLKRIHSFMTSSPAFPFVQRCTSSHLRPHQQSDASLTGPQT
ncbi:hypothetical protein L7F22_022628 [Adiantum nelumboides]|nr:hypothetical protein [Adiantum nelumboides]